MKKIFKKRIKYIFYKLKISVLLFLNSKYTKVGLLRIEALYSTISVAINQQTAENRSTTL